MTDAASGGSARRRAGLRVGVVPGVSVDKWERIWNDRMRRVPLEVRSIEETGAVAALVARTALGARTAFGADGGEVGGPGKDAEVDVVFGRGLTASGELHVIPLWTEVPVAVAAKQHPLAVVDAVTLAELADEDVLDGTDEATLDLVAAGHGVARMPQSVFRATGRRDLVARPVSDAEPTRIGLAWRPGADSELLDAFIGIVRGRTRNSSRG